MPNMAACQLESRRATNGLLRVLGVCASSGDSTIWLNVLAAAEVRYVPVVSDKRSGKLSGSGLSASPVVEVNVTKTLSRFFASWR